MKSLFRASRSNASLLYGVGGRTAGSQHPPPALISSSSCSRQRSARGSSKSDTPLEVPPHPPSIIRLSASETLELHERHIVYSRSDSPVPVSRNEISTVRLLDGCPCPQCLDPSTRQRLTKFSDCIVASQPQPAVHSIESVEGDGVSIVWASDSTNESTTDAQEHRGSYSSSLIRRLAGLAQDPGSLVNESITTRTWRDAEELQQSPQLRIPYVSLQDPVAGSSSLYSLLRQLKSYGIVIIEGVPTGEVDNDQCELKAAIERIGPLHNTFYGETWNVKSIKNSKNVAYTDQNLGLHQDLLYMASPPNYQALHCLRNRVVGGKSYFVDGFAVQDSLIESAPELERRLRGLRIPYEYDNDGHWLYSTHPVFCQNSSGVRHIYWSPPFRGVARIYKRDRRLNDSSKAEVARSRRDEEYYLSLVSLESVIEEPARRFAFTMREGDLVLFNNTRILHARTAFRNLTEDEIQERGVQIVPGEPTRWLKGCYLDEETVSDKLAVLGRSLGYPE